MNSDRDHTSKYTVIFFVSTALNLFTNIICGWFALPDLYRDKSWDEFALILCFELLQTAHLAISIWCYFNQEMIKSLKLYYIIDGAIAGAITIPACGYMIFVMIRMQCDNDPYCLLIIVLFILLMMVILGLGATDLLMDYCLYKMMPTKKKGYEAVGLKSIS